MTNVAGLLVDEQKVFDEYKVLKLQVKYLPYVTGQVRVNTAVAFTAPTDPLLIMSMDYDDSVAWGSTLTQPLNSQNPAIYMKYSDQIRTITMKNKDKAQLGNWLNTQGIIPNVTTPPDPNNPSKLASIKTYTSAYQLASTAEGAFIAEWTCLFKGAYTLA